MAILIGNLVVTLFNFGAGCLANTGDGMNPFIQFLTWISPMHYAIELVFKQVSKGRVAQDQLLDHFGYTSSDGLCYGYLVAFSVFFIAFGWLILWYTNRTF